MVFGRFWIGFGLVFDWFWIGFGLVFGFGFGGAGTGAGGGGLYGGGASPAGGGGGGGYLEHNILSFANTQTGSNATPPQSTYSSRSTGGNGGVAPATPAGDGLIVITIL